MNRSKLAGDGTSTIASACIAAEQRYRLGESLHVCVCVRMCALRIFKFLSSFRARACVRAHPATTWNGPSFRSSVIPNYKRLLDANTIAASAHLHERLIIVLPQTRRYVSSWNKRPFAHGSLTSDPAARANYLGAKWSRLSRSATNRAFRNSPPTAP